MFKTNNLTPEQFARLKKWQLIADIILIVVIAAIGLYVFSEIESVKFLLNDPCQVCMNKTGALCYQLNPFG